MAEDAALLLQDVVGSLDNLPSEISFLLQEIGHKEGKTNDIKNRAIARDQSIQRHARPTAQGGQGLLVANPKEESLIGKIRIDLDRAEAAAKEKVALSERGVNLLSRHLNRLQSQLELLTPNVPPLPTLPSFNVPTNIAAAAPATSSHYGGVGSAAAAQAANAYNPTAHVGQFVNPYAQGYGQQYGYGTPVDKRKMVGGAGSPPTGLSNQIPLLPAHQQHSQSTPGFPYSPSASGSTPIAPSPGAGGNRQVRPSRMSYPGQAGTPGQGAQMGGTPLQQAQIQQQQLAQHQHLQQQQMRLAQQAQQLAAQQMANQHQIAALQGGHGHHGQGGQKRKRHEEEESEATTAGEGEGEGEDMTPYCFCHRPSFGEMIGCDAPDCAIEWFHLACVGLKTVPDASWFCRDCKEKQKSSGGRRRK